MVTMGSKKPRAFWQKFLLGLEPVVVRFMEALTGESLKMQCLPWLMRS
jgi:hypothetical protein